MNRSSSHRVALRVVASTLACAVLVCASSGCSDSFRRSGPPDPVATGTLCLPATDACSSFNVLERNELIGANQLDYELSNLSDESASITIRVGIPSDTMDDDASDTQSEQPADLLELTVRLEPNESRLGRLTQDQLTTRDTLILGIECDNCDAEMQYTLTNEPLECRSDDDCTGPWVCLENFGRCVECESGSDCEPEQACSLETNRCEPPVSGGCQAAPASNTLDATPILVVLIALVWLAVRSHRRSHRRSAVLLTSLILAGLLVGLPARSNAAEPPRATFGMGVGPRWFTGELSGVTKRGIGLQIDQELRWRHFGAAVQLGTRYHLTTQQPPPLSRELQVYTVSAGPRAYVSVGDFSFTASAEYQHVGLVTNSLIRLTGSQLNYGSAGGSLGVRYSISALDLGARAGFYPIFGLDGSLLSVDLTIRLSVK
ncbi:MAG: hypothetical protein ACQEVA_17750 [Myxococcota bacterium]